MRKKNKRGAGFLVYKNIDGEEKLLILLNPEGKFDIPKGHGDNTDLDNFGTAQRECFEETQIFVTRSDLIVNDTYTDGGLTIFCARTNKDPVLTPNPQTKKLEHVESFWLQPNLAIKILPAYLSASVRWSLKYVVNT